MNQPVPFPDPAALRAELAEAEKALAAATRAGDFEEVGRLTDVVNRLAAQLAEGPAGDTI